MEHPDELEADFQQYYGLDIADVLPPRAARLMFQLPRECRVFAKIAPASQWGWNEIMLNKLTYLAELLVWMKTKDATKKSPRNKPKPFVPDFMDQGKATKETDARSVDEIRDILARPRT